MYNALILEHFHSPHNQGRLVQTDASGQVGAPGEGPYMIIALQMDEAQIQNAAFQTYGCPAAVACGSWLTRWVIGKTLAGAQIIEPEELSLILGGLPLGKEHCAQMAVRALRDACKKLENLDALAGHQTETAHLANSI